MKLTHYSSKGCNLALYVSSSGEEKDYASLHLWVAGRCFTLKTAPWLKPKRTWVDTSKESWSRGPGSGFWEVEKREYGFKVWENHFNILYGEQTDSSATEKRWSCFLPWTEWRFSTHAYLDAEGRPVHTRDYLSERKSLDALKSRQERQRLATRFSEENDLANRQVPKVYYSFVDYDGEEIQAETYLEERTWKRGAGLFKWLSIFVPDRKRRSLDITFSKEVGPKKGSWKGGTIGHGIDAPGTELHDAAFGRYAKEYGLKRVRRIAREDYPVHTVVTEELPAKAVT